MLTTALGRDDAFFLSPLFAIDPIDVAAGTFAEATAAAVDLATAFDTVRFSSLTVLLTGKGTLAANEALKVRVTIEDSADGVAWATLEASPAITLLSVAGAGADTGAAKFGTDLTLARRHVRAKVTAVENAGASDTGEIAVVYLFSSPSRA